MTEVLREGVHAKSGQGAGVYLPLRYVSLSGPDVEGRDVTLDLETAVGEIKRALSSDRLAEDVAFSGFMRHLRSMYPKAFGDVDHWPHGRVLTSGEEFQFPADYTGPNVEIMGASLSAVELAQLVDYVMTNTPLDRDDPRERFLEGLRDAPEMAH